MEQNTHFVIGIRNKIPYKISGPDYIVTDNSDYTLELVPDEQWEGLEAKTVYYAFDLDGAIVHPIVGNHDAVPVMTKAGVVYIGVSAGDIRTTRPLTVKVASSIRDMAGVEIPEPEPEVYDRIMEIINDHEVRIKRLETGGTGGGGDGATDITLGITGAVVGKTVKITEVDEDGKPVKWEAADIPAQTDIDSTLSIEGSAADAKAVGDKLTEVSKAIADKLNKSGDTLGGKFVIPTASTTAGFVNSKDMKIFGYGKNNFRMGDPNKQLELHGSGTNPMFGSKKILVEGDIADGLLTVETITVGDNGETETIPVTGLSLDLTTYSATAGNGFYINPVITPSNATNKAVSWQSNATNIATVNDSGYVECITAGNAVITCTTVDGGFTANCAVSVAAVDGGETTGQKIQFSTLAITSGFIKNDGTTATMGNTYNVTIPYSEGMQIITGTNLSWNRSVYPPVVVYDNGTYISPEVTQVGEARSVGGKYATPFTATLTGFTENAIVHASFLAGGTIGDTLETNMDKADIFYYIPGGDA